MSLTFVVGFVLLQSKLGQGCVAPSGLGADSGELDPSTLNLPVNEVYQGFATGIEAFVLDYETPIQFRLIELTSAVIWNSMSSYEETVLDRFGRVNVSESRRRCQDTLDSETFLLRRRITLAYAVYYGLTSFFPEILDTATNLINSWNLNETICDSGSGFDCSDVSTPGFSIYCKGRSGTMVAV